jgi:hypothetical protein
MPQAGHEICHRAGTRPRPGSLARWPGRCATARLAQRSLHRTRRGSSGRTPSVAVLPARGGSGLGRRPRLPPPRARLGARAHRLRRRASPASLSRSPSGTWSSRGASTCPGCTPWSGCPGTSAAATAPRSDRARAEGRLRRLQREDQHGRAGAVQQAGSRRMRPVSRLRSAGGQRGSEPRGHRPVADDGRHLDQRGADRCHGDRPVDAVPQAARRSRKSFPAPWPTGTSSTHSTRRRHCSVTASRRTCSCSGRLPGWRAASPYGADRAGAGAERDRGRS